MNEEEKQFTYFEVSGSGLVVISGMKLEITFSIMEEGE